MNTNTESEWTIKNVRKIQKEFLSSKNNFLLCKSSNTFFKIYCKECGKIKQLAGDFLNKRKNTKFYIGGLCLFIQNEVMDKSMRRIRLDFLSHEIKRLEKEEKK